MSVLHGLRGKLPTKKGGARGFTLATPYSRTVFDLTAALCLHVSPLLLSDTAGLRAWLSYALPLLRHSGPHPHPNLPHFTPTPSYTASGPYVRAPQQMRFPIDSKPADMCDLVVFNIEEEKVVCTSRVVVCVCVSVRARACMCYCVWGGGGGVGWGLSTCRW